MGARHEHSAGGVVLKDHDVAVIKPRGRRTLQLPKGHIDPGETELQAAVREVREEAGVDVEPIKKLGDIEYSYRSRSKTIHKKVSFFLFRYTGGSIKDHDHEVDEVSWKPIDQVAEHLTFDGERAMIQQAVNALQDMDN